MMLRSLDQTCRCLCQCAKRRFPAALVIPARTYQNPSTIVFERRTPVGLIGEGKYPKLKRRHNILKVIVERPDSYSNKIQCILTETVPDIGIKGSLVEVTKRVFRNQLYPSGSAVYASPENLEYYGSEIQQGFLPNNAAVFPMLIRHKRVKANTFEYQKLKDIDQELMSVMNELSKCHLRIFMHKTNNWRIKKEHIRIAFRQVGVVVADENIILPDHAVTEFSSFVFQVQAKDKLRTKVPATVYQILEKKVDPPHEFKYPIFGNKPVNPDVPVEYISEETESSKS